MQGLAKVTSLRMQRQRGLGLSASDASGEVRLCLLTLIETAAGRHIELYGHIVNFFIRHWGHNCPEKAATSWLKLLWRDEM